MAMQETALALKFQIVSSFLMVLPRCLDLVTDTWDLIFRAEGLFYSQPVLVGGTYYLLCYF